MSQRPSAPYDFQDAQQPDDGRRTSASASIRHPAPPVGLQKSGAVPSSDEGQFRPTTSLPPMRTFPAQSQVQHAPQHQHEQLAVPRQRPSKVADILNPAESRTGQLSVNRRRSAAHFDNENEYPNRAGLDISSVRPQDQSLGPASVQSRHAHGSPPQTMASSLDGRRILTPISPSQRATTGPIQNTSISGALDAQERQINLSRSQPEGQQFAQLRAGPGSNPFGPVPTYMPAVQAPNNPRRKSIGLGSKPPSQNASPSASFSSLSQRDHPSPALAPTPTAGFATSYHRHHMNTQGSQQPDVSASSDSSHAISKESKYGLSSATTAQSSYQIMTLNTDQGPINVPVDIQAASKMADDKRKRNAGASARFRQRRKEKEREASQMIGKLEQQAREFAEARDFYRNERNHYRRIVLDRLGPKFAEGRPPSPHVQQIPQDGTSLAAAPWTPTPPPQGLYDRPVVTVGRSASVMLPGQLPPIASPSPQAPPMPPGSHPLYRTASYPLEQQRPTGMGPTDTQHQPSPQHHHQQQQQVLHLQQPHPSHVGPAASQHPPVPKSESYDPYAPDHYDRSWPSKR